MLNKIIKQLEAKIEESKIIKIESTIVQSIEAGRRNAFKSAIYIIKQHESEFNHHPLSPEDIERAAKDYVIDNVFDSSHIADAKSFIAGANFAKQPIANTKTLTDDEIEDVIERFKDDTSSSVFATHTFTNWLKSHYSLTPLPHPPKK